MAPFLTAAWTNLLLVNYRVPPELLRPYLPPGSELDTPDSAPDLHLLSLVAFHFERTRVWGIPLPTAQHFPEINLRFYLRRDEKRAVLFLREFVPTPLVALGARLLYHQPYHLATIAHQIRNKGGRIHAYTRFRHGPHRGELRVRAHNEPAIPPPESEAHFLKEHYWGFDRTPHGKSFRYRVDHPLWATYPVESAEVHFDPGALLGGAWQEIDWEAARHSVLFARGSDVVVHGAEPLEAP